MSGFLAQMRPWLGVICNKTLRDKKHFIKAAGDKPAAFFIFGDKK